MSRVTQPKPIDADRAFEQLRKEHRLTLQAGDLEALQRVQEKLDELLVRKRNPRFA